jgi:hypothetical protein
VEQVGEAGLFTRPDERLPNQASRDDGGKVPNGEQRGLPRDDAATPSFHATTRRSPKIPNAATAASSGMPKGRAVLYPANQAWK